MPKDGETITLGPDVLPPGTPPLAIGLEGKRLDIATAGSDSMTKMLPTDRPALLWSSIDGPRYYGLLGELKIIVEEAKPRRAMFRTNHASNYLPLRGDLTRAKPQMLELIDDGQNGLHAAPGDARDLAATLQRFWSEELDRGSMRRRARRTFEDRYTPAKNYQALLRIYQQALDVRHG